MKKKMSQDELVKLILEDDDVCDILLSVPYDERLQVLSKVSLHKNGEKVVKKVSNVDKNVIKTLIDLKRKIMLNLSELNKNINDKIERPSLTLDPQVKITFEANILHAGYDDTLFRRNVYYEIENLRMRASAYAKEILDKDYKTYQTTIYKIAKESRLQVCMIDEYVTTVLQGEEIFKDFPYRMFSIN